MSGLNVVFNIATSALEAQTNGLNVTSHNIANVNTEGYSKQDPVYAVNDPQLLNGLIFGTGVDTTSIQRSSNVFIENQLIQKNSDLVSYSEMEKFVNVLEGIFDESSGTNVNSMLSEFWNAWSDVSNNPSGSSERIILYEQSVLLTEQFNALKDDLAQLKVDLTTSVTNGVEIINQLAEEIATLNVRIASTESGSSANDLRDQRLLKIRELAEYIDVKYFEQDNGNMTVLSAKGSILVNGSSAYALRMGGADGESVLWQNLSGTTSIDITDHITAGKMGGWLEMRDEILAKVQLDFDSLASSFIYTVNQQHSRGVGLELFEPGISLSGTYATDTTLGDLDFGGQIGFVADAFTLWIEDRSVPGSPVMNSVAMDLSGLDADATLADLAAAINGQIAAAGLTGVSADGSGSTLVFNAGAQHAFGFSADQSGLLAALGVNTFFTGTDAGSIEVHSLLKDTDYIAAAQISGGTFTSGDNRNALAMTDLQFAAVEIASWTCDRINGNTEQLNSATIGEGYGTMLGSLGGVAASITSRREFSEVMVNNISAMRDSVSGVSIDEEMTRLIQFQHAYAAAGKLISVADEMIAGLLEIR